MAIRYVATGYVDGDTDTDYYPDLSDLKMSSQTIRDNVAALIHLGDGENAVRTKRNRRTLAEIEQAALRIANALANIRAQHEEEE